MVVFAAADQLSGDSGSEKDGCFLTGLEAPLIKLASLPAVLFPNVTNVLFMCRIYSSRAG